MPIGSKVRKLFGPHERLIANLWRGMFMNLDPWTRTRYLISGGFCALANNVLLITGAHVGLGIFELTLLSFLVIGTAGYVAHVHFTFRQTPGWRSYARFMAGLALGIPAAYAVLALLCDVLHVPMLATAPIATIILLVYNYMNARLAIMSRLFR